jgi:tetratricopeptide (TPR) repeat protein
VEVVRQLEQALRSSPGADPRLRALHARLRSIARQAPLALARELEREGLTRYGVVLVHQQLGDLFLQLGQGEEALKQYEQARELLARTTREHPEDDKARANYALIQSSIGNAVHALSGDAPAARRYLRKALALQQDVERHPGNRSYTAEDNRRLLARYALALAGPSLEAGDAATARDCYRRVLAYRRELAGKKPGDLSLRSFLAEAYYRLGDASWRLEDARAARRYYREALARCEALVAEKPLSVSYRCDLAEVSDSYGEALARLGKASEGLPYCQKSVRILESMWSRAPGHPALREPLARAYARRAGVLLALGKDAQARQDLERELRLRESLGVDQATLMLALARCGRHAEACRLGDQLRVRAPRWTATLFQLARGYARCAAWVEGPARRRYTARALEALRAATAGGYSDLFVLETDPDLKPLRSEPAYRRLLGALGAGRRPGPTTPGS